MLVRGPHLAAELRAHTGDWGVDVILDPQGTDLLDLDLELAAAGARIVLFGNTAGGPLAPLPPAGRLFATNTTIGAFSLSRMAEQIRPRRPGAARCPPPLATGALDVAVQELDGLEAAPGAHDELATGRGSGKRVVRVAESDGP